MRSIIVVALFWLLLAIFANAQISTIVWHEVRAVVDSNGNANVHEQFYFQAPTAEDQREFERITRQNGVELSKWRQFNPSITPHFGRTENIRNGILTINADPSNPGQRLIELSYELATPLATPVEPRTERLIRFEINSEKNKSILVPFKVGPLIQIPAATQLRLELPSGARVVETIPQPSQRPAENQLVWQDTQANQFNVAYTLRLPVKTINLTQPLREFLSTFMGQVSILLLAVVLLLAYFFRQPIGERIEDFLANHTELDKDDSDEKEKTE